jgi:hypothetical protein
VVPVRKPEVVRTIDDNNDIPERLASRGNQYYRDSYGVGQKLEKETNDASARRRLAWLRDHPDVLRFFQERITQRRVVDVKWLETELDKAKDQKEKEAEYKKLEGEKETAEKIFEAAQKEYQKDPSVENKKKLEKSEAAKNTAVTKYNNAKVALEEAKKPRDETKDSGGKYDNPQVCIQNPKAINLPESCGSVGYVEDSAAKKGRRPVIKLEKPDDAAKYKPVKNDGWKTGKRVCCTVQTQYELLGDGQWLNNAKADEAIEELMDLEDNKGVKPTFDYLNSRATMKQWAEKGYLVSEQQRDVILAYGVKDLDKVDFILVQEGNVKARLLPLCKKGESVDFIKPEHRDDFVKLWISKITGTTEGKGTLPTKVKIGDKALFGGPSAASQPANAASQPSTQPASGPYMPADGEVLEGAQKLCPPTRAGTTFEAALAEAKAKTPSWVEDTTRECGRNKLNSELANLNLSENSQNILLAQPDVAEFVKTLKFRIRPQRADEFIENVAKFKRENPGVNLTQYEPFAIARGYVCRTGEACGKPTDFKKTEEGQAPSSQPSSAPAVVEEVVAPVTATELSPKAQEFWTAKNDKTKNFRAVADKILASLHAAREDYEAMVQKKKALAGRKLESAMTSGRLMSEAMKKYGSEDNLNRLLKEEIFRVLGSDNEAATRTAKWRITVGKDEGGNIQEVKPGRKTEAALRNYLMMDFLRNKVVVAPAAAKPG